MASPNITFPDYTYTVSYATPSTATYRHLRRSAGGLSDKSDEACAIGLPRSMFCVLVLATPTTPSGSAPVTVSEGDDHDRDQAQPDPRVVGMGRLVGDGALFVQVVDIAVLPAHQKRGLGKLVVGELVRWIGENVPKTCYVSLMADGEAKRLYALYGFVETAQGGTVGMSFRGKLKEAST